MKRGGLPSVIVWVVRIAYSVEVELLQKLDVSQHGVFSHSFAPAVLVHVAVYTLDHDGLVVVQQLPPLDLILAKPHLGRHCSCANAVKERKEKNALLSMTQQKLMGNASLGLAEETIDRVVQVGRGRGESRSIAVLLSVHVVFDPTVVLITCLIHVVLC